MTYFVINFILVIENQLNLVSFRPTFKITVYIPIIGSLACVSAIIIVSPFIGLACLLISLGIYIYLDRKALDNPYETLNTGLFGSIANWAARKVVIDDESNNLRSWKPDILFPIERATQLEGNFQLLLSMVHPQGSIQAIGFVENKQLRPMKGLKATIKDFQEEKIFASAALIESNGFIQSLRTSASVMKSSFFQPNILFVPIKGRNQEELEGILDVSRDNKLGVAFLAKHPDTGFGKSRNINVWISDQSPNWHLGFQLANIDLPLLIAYQLIQNANARLKVITLVSNTDHVEPAKKYLHDLMTLARIPNGYEILAIESSFNSYIHKAPHADINIFGLGSTISKKFMEKAVDSTESTCLFIRNSGTESVLV